MRHALEPDHDLLGDDEAPRDLVLGAPALLGIFIAVVLVCAVCFGFGYSSGHGFHFGTPTPAASAPTQPSPSTAAALTTPTPEADIATPEQAAEAAPVAGALDQREQVAQRAPAKPAPGVESSAVPVPDSMSAASPRSADVSRGAASQAHATQEALAPPATPQPAATSVTSGDATSATAPAQNLALMVQIAAVTQAADAATLSHALRHDGYNAIVRTTTGDPYFHVQVGPFGSYDAAKAMRARLASSGYTAFIRH